MMRCRRGTKFINATAANKMTLTMISTTAQFGFLAFAALLGFNQSSVWWLLPLTLLLGLVGWLTDPHWKIRFYDIYNIRMWARFWPETLFGLICLMFAAYVAGRIVYGIADFYAFAP